MNTLSPDRHSSVALAALAALAAPAAATAATDARQAWPAEAPSPSPGAETAVGTAAALAAATALSACGGGGDGAVTPAPAPAPAAAPITDAQASRFLGQAAFGATDPLIGRVKALGYSAWLDEQLAQPIGPSRYDWMVAQGHAVEANISAFTGADNALWRKLIASPDVLRQRVALALSEIFVVSMAGLPVLWRGLLVTAYADLLETHCFASYRSLLEAVTLSPAMGVYLNMRGNQREDLATGRVPDENFAREVLQLFAIGLQELNTDGSLRGGAATETYGPDTISNLAKVFTGWDFDNATRTDFAYVKRPMLFNAARHSVAEKRFLGTTIAAGTDGRVALGMALDTIAKHANVAPFIGRQLIQRLVASHPSAAYVGRVSAVFNNNGAGQHGDLKAVIKAVLLDPEARSVDIASPSASPSPTAGKLREPVVRLVQWARTFGLASPTDLWNLGNQSDPATRLGQSPLRAPSVFNFFRPGYVPPNSALGTQGVTAPEFQITNESTVMGWANYAQTFVASGIGETRPDYSAELALATDAPALVRRVVLLLAADALPAATETLISTAVASISAATDTGKRNRVYAAIHLVLCAPDYLVQV